MTDPDIFDEAIAITKECVEGQITMTDPTTIARGIAPCWGDGISGPKNCDESFECELHSRLATALQEYGDQRAFEQLTVDHAYLEKERAKADAEGYRRGVEEAANFCFFQYEWHMRHERYCCAKTAKECKEGIRKLQHSTGGGE